MNYNILSVKLMGLIRLQLHIMGVLFQVMITHVRSQTRFEASAMAMEFLCQLSINLELI